MPLSQLALQTFLLFGFILTNIFHAAYAAEKHTLRILMVVSSYGVQQGKVKPGFEFDELSKAYLLFRNNGVAVDIASPKGGTVEADQYDPSKPYNQAFLADSQAVRKLDNTLNLSTVQSDNYNGLFIVGGKGAMFDLPDNKHLQHIIRDLYQMGGTVAAVCHGPAALVNVKLDNGRYLIADKKINGFTNEEEHVFTSQWVSEFDFLLEDKMKQRGALFEHSPMMLSHVAIDKGLITGQNPSSTVDTAEALLTSLGLTSIKTPHYRDDTTLQFIANVLSGDNTAIKHYKNHKTDYEVPLIGMYGYHHFKQAQSHKQIKQALTLMLLAQTDMQHPKIGLQIAKAYQQLGELEAAKSTLHTLLKTKADFSEAQDLLQTLSKMQ